MTQELKPDQVVRNMQQSSLNFRWGSTGTDVKLYFDDIDDLLDKLNSLVKQGQQIDTLVRAFKATMKEV